MTTSTKRGCLRTLLGASILAGCVTATPAQAQVALVIGNANYAAQPKLAMCDMSANLAAAALTRAGFRVTQLANPSNARMGTAIASVGDEIAATPGTTAVIYVCGYVASYADRLFLLPVEARLERDTDVLSQGIVARALLTAAAAGDAAALVLIDVAARPGTDLALTAALARPADLVHVGFAAARITPAGDQMAAPLAAGLADMLRSRDVELTAALAELSKTKAALVTVRPPGGPTWLVGRKPAPSPAAPVVAPALADPNPADRRRVQVALKDLGYFQGRVTGRFERDTEAAIRQMQRESGEEATGRLTAAQMKRLLDH